jgi:hypothetical protein
MHLLTTFAPRQWGRRARLGTLSVAAIGALVIGTAGFSPSAQAKVSHHSRTHAKSHSKTKSAAGRPCLEGNWNVTSLTLSTSGLTFTGGSGTTVDIGSNGNALGNFTPGAPLTGTAGSAKFNGTLTDHYGFSPKTTAHSGSFPVTPVTNNATITVAGVTRAVTSSTEQGMFTCTGKDLSLTFTSGASTLTYKMTPAD